MSTNAAYASTPRYEIAYISAAVEGFDGASSTAIVTLFTGGDDGSRVDQIGWAAQGTTTAGCLKFFARESSTDQWRLFFTASVAARSVSVLAPPVGGGYSNLNWILKAGAQIGVATHNAEPFMVHVTNSGDF
jgi:hypothetical protein